MQKQDTPPFFKRIFVYFKERFPFFTYLTFVSILYLSLSFISQILTNKTPYINKQSLLGIISAFFFMLLIRTFDDIKDQKLDDEIFPNRPVSRGAVLISDVKLLAVLSFVILIVINGICIPKTRFLFSLVMLYLLLTFKWFFTEELHLKNPKFAMLTHQPIPFVILFYLIHIALVSSNTYAEFTKNHLLTLFIFALPITAWEVSRKIKTKEKENKYETFSKIFGTTLAVLIPLFLYTIASLLSMWLAHIIHFHNSYYVFISCYLLFLYYYFLRFLFYPTDKNNHLQKIAMIFTVLLFTTLIVYLVSKYPISIKL